MDACIEKGVLAFKLLCKEKADKNGQANGQMMLFMEEEAGLFAGALTADGEKVSFFSIGGDISEQLVKEEIARAKEAGVVFITNDLKKQLPELPEAKKARYKSEYGLTDYDTDMICSSVSYVRLFERTVEITGNPKDSAHWIMGEVMKLLNDSQTLPEDMHFNPDALGRIIQLQNGNKISRDSAKKVLAAVFTDNVDPDEYVKQNQMEMVSDTGAIRKAVEDVLAQNEKAVNEYKGGKAASFNFLIGQCMRALRGKAPAAEVTKILKEILG